MLLSTRVGGLLLAASCQVAVESRRTRPVIEPGQEAFKDPEVLTRERVMIWVDTLLEPGADCGSVICPSPSGRTGL